MDFDVSELAPGGVYSLLVAGVQPRPIAWVSTQSLDGVANLAPFSFFNVVSVTPPLLAISILNQATGRDKDTLANIRATGELVVNLVSADLAEAMNLSCGPYPAEVDEFDLAGLAKAKGCRVKVPGVAASRLRLECTLRDCLSLGEGPGAGNLVLAEVRHVHVRDDLWRDGQLDSAGLQAVGKLAGDGYSLAELAFSLRRP